MLFCLMHCEIYPRTLQGIKSPKHANPLLTGRAMFFSGKMLSLIFLSTGFTKFSVKMCPLCCWKTTSHFEETILRIHLDFEELREFDPWSLLQMSLAPYNVFKWLKLSVRK